MPNGTVMRTVYNELGQKIQEIEDEGGLNLTTNYTYDLNGNRLTTTDPEGMVTRSVYDARNRLISETQDDGGLNLTITYRYDQAGNLRFLTDAKNQTTEMVYDALNRLRKEIRPMTEETEYWYDDAGNLEEKQDAKGQTTTYTYNDANQLLQISYEGGTTVTFTYDRMGNLETYNDGTTSATYTYDDLGRKLTETVNYGQFSKTFSYEYDDNGIKKAFTMPDGTRYEYTYHADNTLQKISIPGQGDIAYPSYTLNRPDSVTFPGGSQQSYQYDTLMRLERIQAPEMDYQYTAYDGVSNILTKQMEHGNYGYGYDDLYRLTSVDNPTLDDEAYTYDGVGNRETASGVSGTITHNANNELTLYGEIGYDYDANGNMTEKRVDGQTEHLYVYNTENRLVRVEDGSGTLIAEYYYDPFGRRLWKEVDGVRTYFLYANEGLVAEYDDNGNELRAYGYIPNFAWTTDPLFQKVGSTYYWYQNDQLGTPQTIIDINGNVVWEAQYNAFGNAQVAVNTIENNLRFPGQYYDAETGLYYNWFRYYDPVIGRYLRTDPIKSRGGINVFLYVQNNPITFLDPLGLSSVECVKGIGDCIAQKMKEYVDKGISMDCADAALTALIECAAKLKAPLSLPVWDANAKKWKYLRSKNYRSLEAFAETVRSKMGATNLFDRNKVTVPRELKELQPGDLILFDLQYHGDPNYTGHTMVVIENDDEAWFWPLTVGEGHLSGPIEDSWYSYDGWLFGVLNKWNGPVEGKGRTWNCKIFDK